ncbi:MAG: hypothetical protein PVH19_06995 [Planctomycetia bacterium]|jgi:hypothetical protein
MSIKVKCPNGHLLKVKDSFAGKVGLCPMCQAKIRVPVPQPAGQISEDDIIDVLGPHSPPPQRSASTSGIALDPASDSALGSSSSILGPSDSSLQLGDDPLKNGASESTVGAMPKKICSKCNREISAGFHICPFCRTYVANLSDL